MQKTRERFVLMGAVAFAITLLLYYRYASLEVHYVVNK
jgi:hypothetical protein